MNKLSNVLHEVFGANLADEFVKRASYNESMDFLEYIACDCIAVSERVDGFLTVMWNYEHTEIIGFKLKGFKYLFNTHIKDLAQLKDSDFNPIMDMLEIVFTMIGNEIISDTAMPKDERLKAYKATRELIKKDAVKLPVELMAA